MRSFARLPWPCLHWSSGNSWRGEGRAHPRSRLKSNEPGGVVFERRSRAIGRAPRPGWSASSKRIVKTSTPITRWPGSIVSKVLSADPSGCIRIFCYAPSWLTTSAGKLFSNSRAISKPAATRSAQPQRTKSFSSHNREVLKFSSDSFRFFMTSGSFHEHSRWFVGFVDVTGRSAIDSRCASYSPNPRD